MFLREKKLNKEINNYNIIELIYSGVGFSVIVEHPIKNNKVSGKIVKLSKKQFKKKYKKIKKCKYEPISEELKKEIIDNFNRDKLGILNYTEDYIEQDKLRERKKLTEEEIEINKLIYKD